MAEPLLIVGASGRAAAASALRAGFDPFVIDLFADADTCRLCPTLKCDPADYPHGFIELTKRAPPGPWMYTGGLENYPDVVAAISEKRELVGNGPEVLRRVRDPWFLDSLPKHVAGFAEVAARANDTAPLGWVRKPLAGSGGGGVRRVEHGDRADDAGVYYQEFIAGEPESAMFHLNDSPATSLGLTLQLVGTPWLHARPFQYAGNVSRLRRPYPVGAWESGLRRHVAGLGGLIGIDFIGQSVLEVNPRYPASLEVLEFAHGCPMLDRDSPPPPMRRVVGKAIYYAAAPLTFPATGPWDDSLARCRDVWALPNFADIPHPGSVIETGQPVFTLFAAASTEGECVNQLKARAAKCDRVFGIPEETSP